MRFRVQTIMVATAMVGLVLTMSAGLPIAWRAALGFAILGIWAGAALLVWGLDQVHSDRSPRARHIAVGWTLVVAGAALASSALSLSGLILGMALRMRFMNV